MQVLFRFLEFFSNFDWEKFCLSLSGPVPISSLPDMTGNLMHITLFCYIDTKIVLLIIIMVCHAAEPPWMDSSELLLSKAFLDSCSSAYGVMPCTQESQGQPFVSKHFNVIDPLRMNNNLGRSVSKGNYQSTFRLRSSGVDVSFTYCHVVSCNLLFILDLIFFLLDDIDKIMHCAHGTFCYFNVCWLQFLFFLSGKLQY
jgi:hypothetical protein